MVCVDTSVWITAFRERQSAQAKYLAGLLDNDEVGLIMPVKIELLSGAPHRTASFHSGHSTPISNNGPAEPAQCHRLGKRR